jgi:hypothetical protein
MKGRKNPEQKEKSECQANIPMFLRNNTSPTPIRITPPTNPAEPRFGTFIPMDAEGDCCTLRGMMIIPAT